MESCLMGLIFKFLHLKRLNIPGHENPGAKNTASQQRNCSAGGEAAGY
jgi:hypothetical protein